MTTKRETIELRQHGGRVYGDSIKTKKLPGGTVIRYADGVEPFVDDWDRNEVPRPFNEPERGPRQ